MVTEYGINLRDLCFLSCCQHCKGSGTFEEWHSRLYLYFWEEMLDVLLRTQQELEAAETKRRATLPVTSLTAAIPAQGRDSQLPPSSEHHGSQDSGSWAFHRCLFGQSMALGPVPALLAIPTLPAVPLCPCGGNLLPPATELPPCSFLLWLHLTKIFVLLLIMKEWIGDKQYLYRARNCTPIYNEPPTNSTKHTRSWFEWRWILLIMYHAFWCAGLQKQADVFC